MQENHQETEDSSGSEIICQCNGVSKAEILEVISKYKNPEIRIISRETAAGTGCGRCQRIIRYYIEKA